MTVKKSPEEGFDGFITSSKGITLSFVSLAVWAVTLLAYRMTSVIAGKQLTYDVFCL